MCEKTNLNNDLHDQEKEQLPHCCLNCKERRTSKKENSFTKDEKLPPGFAYVEGVLVFPAPKKKPWWDIMGRLEDLVYEASKHGKGLDD